MGNSDEGLNTGICSSGNKDAEGLPTINWGYNDAKGLTTSNRGKVEQK